jgi:hypothetical protein
MHFPSFHCGFGCSSDLAARNIGQNHMLDQNKAKEELRKDLSRISILEPDKRNPVLDMAHIAAAHIGIDIVVAAAVAGCIHHPEPLGRSGSNNLELPC